MDELRERIENTITRTFNVSGMPLPVWEEINQFCVENFGDSRWTMVYSLMKSTKDDFKYNMLYNEIEFLKERIVVLETDEPVKGINVNQRVKTFGMKKGDETK